MFVLFVLGSLTTWRVTAGVVAVIPVVTMIMISQVNDNVVLCIINPICSYQGCNLSTNEAG